MSNLKRTYNDSQDYDKSHINTKRRKIMIFNDYCDNKINFKKGNGCTT